MLEGFAEDLEQDLRDLHRDARAQPPADSTVERDRRVRMTGNMATAARKILQLDGAAREAARPAEDNEDGMRERLDDPEALERKHREIDERLARIRQHLDAGGAAIMDDTRRNGSLPQELAHEGQPRAA
ncbi:MAG: hypothetical protein Q7J28_11110 [Caulobacter sp.]|nr:hypothetical protein [Caulobacter sp.]